MGRASAAALKLRQEGNGARSFPMNPKKPNPMQPPHLVVDAAGNLVPPPPTATTAPHYVVGATGEAALAPPPVSFPAPDRISPPPINTMPDASYPLGLSASGRPEVAAPSATHFNGRTRSDWIAAFDSRTDEQIASTVKNVDVAKLAAFLLGRRMDSIAMIALIRAGLEEAASATASTSRPVSTVRSDPPIPSTWPWPVAHKKA